MKCNSIEFVTNTVGCFLCGGCWTQNWMSTNEHGKKVPSLIQTTGPNLTKSRRVRLLIQTIQEVTETAGRKEMHEKRVWMGKVGIGVHQRRLPRSRITQLQ
jgi:hypothetical protein